MPKKLTHIQYIQKITEANIDVEVLEEYVDAHTKILHHCKICNHEWYANPNNILNGKGCPKCGSINSINKRTKTHEEYIEEVTKINSNIEVLGTYINNHTKILHRCKIDGYEWNTKPSGVLKGNGCPLCAGTIQKTHEEYIKEVLLINPNIEAVDMYINAKTPILHKCKICGHQWNAIPYNIISGKNGCPVCSHQIIGNSPEYKNSIWSSEYKEYFSKYMTEEQMKQYMPYSNKKIEIVCPDCGKIKQIKICKLLIDGLSCVCRDGNSYPNKFMCSILNQLNINYIPEYSPDWIGKKRYDIYIPEISCIIENHGAQHYKYSFESIGGKTLEEEQKNDAYKKYMAKENGIQHYIIIDCQVSTMKWIKKSVLSSELCDLLHIKEDNINWELCDEFANTNFVKKCAELWNKGYTIREISNNLYVCNSTIVSYLKKATNIKMCNYSSKESRSRSALSGDKNPRARKIIRINDCKIYGCLKDASIENHLSTVTITKYCKQYKDFMYYDDYIAMYG